jgi:diguanylate cyclase (GGDEF)-like protein/PAS domain S-box-containing protein
VQKLDRPHLDRRIVLGLTVDVADPKLTRVNMGMDLERAIVHALLATLDEGIVIHESDGSIAYSNAAASRILGLSPDQIAGRTPLDPGWESVHEDGSPWSGEDHPAMRALRLGVVTHDDIMGVRTGGGTRVWIAVNARPVHDAGELVGAIATFRDVTLERAAADQALGNERQLLDALSSSGLAVATSNPNGHLLSANAAFCAMIGRNDEDVIGRHFSEFSGPEELPAQFEGVDRIGAGLTDQFQTTKTYLRPDGSRRHGIMNLVALRDRTGRLVRHVSVVHDITDQITTEATLIREASTDHLTGALNRRGLLAELDRLVADPASKPLLLGFVDLDGFKQVNDELGHHTGDLVLSEVATAIRSVVRQTDPVARLGGDEFVVVFPAAPIALADRLRSSLASAIDSIRIEGLDRVVSASIGIVAVDDGASASEALHRADAAMYQVKKRRSTDSGRRSADRSTTGAR